MIARCLAITVLAALALAKAPKNVYVLTRLGVLAAKKQSFGAAEKSFTVAASLDPRNTFSLRWLGIPAMRREKQEEARAWFEKALAVDKNDADAYYFLGILYHFSRNPEKALVYLKKARDADGGEAETHFRLECAFADLGMEKNARLEYLRALDIVKRHTRALNALGWVLFNLQDAEGAMMRWREVFKINPNDADARANLARVLNGLAGQTLSVGNRAAALRYWNQTLAVDPKNKAAVYYMGSFKP